MIGEKIVERQKMMLAVGMIDGDDEQQNLSELLMVIGLKMKQQFYSWELVLSLICLILFLTLITSWRTWFDPITGIVQWFSRHALRELINLIVWLR